MKRFQNLYDPEVTSLESITAKWIRRDADQTAASVDDTIHVYLDEISRIILAEQFDDTVVVCPADGGERRRIGRYLSRATSDLHGVVIRGAFNEWIGVEEPDLPPRSLLREQVRRLRILRTNLANAQ